MDVLKLKLLKKKTWFLVIWEDTIFDLQNNQPLLNLIGSHGNPWISIDLLEKSNFFKSSYTLKDCCDKWAATAKPARVPPEPAATTKWSLASGETHLAAPVKDGDESNQNQQIG